VKEPSSCNCLNLRRAALRMTKLYDKYLTPSGLTVTQFALMNHLFQHGPMSSVSELASLMRLDRTTIARNLRPLERAGIIADASIPGTRSRELKLTQSGAARCKEAVKLWEDAQRSIEDTIGQENIQRLTELLSAIENFE
jgi:DNA-binding MarR family transcriptional regulator